MFLGQQIRTVALTAGEPSLLLYRGEANLRQRETRQQKAHPSELFQH